jgi:hypothetical protein
MALGYNGFEIGKELGGALAAPTLDFHPAIAQYIQDRQRQQQQKADIMKMVGNDIATFDPNKIMDKDLPEFHQLYQDYKDAAIANPEVLANPRRNMKLYSEIMDKRNKLTNFTVNARDSKMVMGQVLKMISQSSFKDMNLNDGAHEFISDMKTLPTSAWVQKYGTPPSIDDFVASNPFGYSPQQAMQQVDAFVKLHPSNVLTEVPTEEGSISNNYKHPDYTALIGNLNSRYAIDPKLQDYFDKYYQTVSPQTMAAIQTSVRQAYADVPSKVFGDNAVTENYYKNFTIQSPEDLYEAIAINHLTPATTRQTMSAEMQAKQKAQSMAIREANYRMALQNHNYQMSKFYTGLDVSNKNRYASIYKSNLDKLIADERANIKAQWKAENVYSPNPSPMPDISADRLKTLAQEAEKQTNETFRVSTQNAGPRGTTLNTKPQPKSKWDNNLYTP